MKVNSESLVSGKVVTYFGIRHRQQLKLVREFGHCSETLLYCVLRADLGRLKRCLAFFSFQDEVTQQSLSLGSHRRKAVTVTVLATIFWCRWVWSVWSVLDSEAFFPLCISLSPHLQDRVLKHDPLILGSFSFFLIIIVAILAYICLKNMCVLKYSEETIQQSLLLSEDLQTQLRGYRDVLAMLLHSYS